MKKIVLATKNKGKIREFNEALKTLGMEGISVNSVIEIDEPIENGKTFLENAKIKACYYAKATGFPCIADDSGLVVDALDGAPGIYSARFAGHHGDDEANNQKLVSEMKHIPEDKRQCAYVCALVLAYPNGKTYDAQGRCGGFVQLTPAGADGFGYDPYFYLPAYEKTMAEISLEEKNKISHRGKALLLLMEQLKNA